MSSFLGDVVFWPTEVSGRAFVAGMVAMAVVKVLLERALFPLARKSMPPAAFAGGRIDPNLSFFTIHFLVNMVVCYLAVPDTLWVLAHPVEWRASENLGHALVMAVHIFHVLFYYDSLTTMDYVHHGVSVGLVGSMGYLFLWGAGLHAMDFFICGLPGGLDYGMLALVKMGAMRKITNKRVNKWLNIAVRWPGILLVCYIMVVTKLNMGDSAPVGWLPIWLVLFLHGGNGLYFAARVVTNTAEAEYALRMEKKAAKQ